DAGGTRAGAGSAALASATMLVCALWEGRAAGIAASTWSAATVPSNTTTTKSVGSLMARVYLTRLVGASSVSGHSASAGATAATIASSLGLTASTSNWRMLRAMRVKAAPSAIGGWPSADASTLIQRTGLTRATTK